MNTHMPKVSSHGKRPRIILSIRHYFPDGGGGEIDHLAPARAESQHESLSRNEFGHRPPGLGCRLGDDREAGCVLFFIDFLAGEFDGVPYWDSDCGSGGEGGG